MNETNKNSTPKKGTLRIDPSKLSAKLGGKVTQNFQGGRSKSVQVEVKKSKTFTRDSSGKIVEVKKEDATKNVQIPKKDMKLTTGEQTARVKALEESKEQAKREQEEKARREEEKAKKAEEEKKLQKAKEEELALKQREEQAKKELEEKKKLLQKANKNNVVKDVDELIETKKTKHKPRPAEISDSEDEVNLEEVMKRSINEVLSEEEYEDYSDDSEIDNDDTGVYEKSSSSTTGTSFVEPVKRTDKIILKVPNPERIRKNLLSESKGTSKNRRKTTAQMMQPKPMERPLKRRGRKGKKVVVAPEDKIIREVLIPEIIEVKELANRMAEQTFAVIKELMKLGIMVNANQTIDADTAEIIVQEFGHTFTRISVNDIENLLLIADIEENKTPRPPVVTVMGHVDHGKTSLLDALRSTDVTAGEAGGITQHIGAYQVTLENGKKITFLDTPGHAAFSTMRARGANITDIVILVVAADDGIMEQTKEAIKHSQAANVPIIVAINKIDKPDANPQKVMNELFQYGLVPEEAGGETMVVEVSAKEKLNLDKLEETILLQAEVMELKAEKDRTAMGVVVESKVDKNKGTIATVLVEKGTLKTGDIVLADKSFGYARTLSNDKGEVVAEALPSVPVEITGLDNAPDAGSIFHVVENEKIARDIINHRVMEERKRVESLNVKKDADNFFAKKGDRKELNVIIKADVNGSAEAIVGTLEKIKTDEVDIKFLHSAVGGITESDVTLAMTTNATILAFNVRPTSQAKDLAKRENVEILYYSVIYNLVDDIKALIGGLLSPIIKEKFLGIAEIRDVFNVSKIGKVAGCMVTEGIIKRGASVRLLRNNIVIHEGSLKTLKRFKDDVKEVREGYECGAAFEKYDDIRANDKIEAFELEEIARTVE